MDNLDFLKLQYKEGLNQIRCYIDARYKILQFIGFYNAAILTFGFGQQVISITEPSFGGIIICFISILVSLMGISTEYSVYNYNKEYFIIIRKIESILLKRHVDEIGIFTHGGNAIRRYISYNKFPVNFAHRVFYFILTAFWFNLLIYHVFWWLKL